MADTLYKWTGPGGLSYRGGTGRWTLGRWRSVRGRLVPCERGLHLCRADQLIDWLARELWEAEADGEFIEANGKIVTRRARIVRRVETWTPRTARLFAADCAEHVLPFFEAACPGDLRPREAIAVARRYADGRATEQEMAAAYDAARAAARAADGAAAYDAAYAAAAARTAAYDAARALERSWQSRRLIEMLGLDG